MLAGLLPPVVNDHAIESRLYLARAVPAKENLHILQRVAGLGDPDALANDLVKIDELPTPQQVVQLGFSCAVDHRKAF